MTKRAGSSTRTTLGVKVYAKPKAPRTEPLPYLKMLRTDLSSYLKITVENVPVDNTFGLVWNVWTKGGPKGNLHVDTWAVIDTEDAPHGCVALASTRTPWAMWVETAKDFEWNAVKAIQRITGVRHPKRVI